MSDKLDFTLSTVIKVKADISVLTKELELAEKTAQEVAADMSVLAIELELDEETVQDGTADMSFPELGPKQIVRAKRRYP